MLSWKNCPIMPINAVQNRKRRFSCFLNAWFSLLSEKEIMHAKTRKLKSLCGFVLIGMICHFFSAISYITVMMYKHKLCVIWTRIDIWNKKKSKNFEIMHSKKRAWFGQENILLWIIFLSKGRESLFTFPISSQLLVNSFLWKEHFPVRVQFVPTRV